MTSEHPALQASFSRLYYLDNLRSLIILFVIVFHIAMAFMVFAPVWWPVIDPQQSLFFTGVVLLGDVPIMPIMFMIAGYFGMASLRRKGVAAFWKDKLLRIVLPWVLGFLIVAPLSPYLWLVARHQNPPYSYFWRHMFFTKIFSTQGALWFLGVLTVFYIGLTIVYLLYKRASEVDATTQQPGWKFFCLFLLVPSAVFILINQFWFDFAWVPVKYILWVQPTRVSLEAFYFALGVYAWKRRWFSAEGCRPNPAVWTCLAIASGAGFLAYKFHVGFLMPLLRVRIGHGLMHCFFCLATTVALFGLFRNYLNWTSPLLTRLARGSYAIYWIHMPLVFLANLAIRGLHWNIYLKYIAASALAVIASFVAGAYGLAWLPMFAGRRAAGDTTTPAAQQEGLREEVG